MDKDIFETDIECYFRGILNKLKKVRIFGYAEDRSLYVQDKCIEPRYSQMIRNHSPDGFSWGYHGSGCAQSALAILLELLPRELAEGMYQKFKSDFVSKWEQGKDFDETIKLYDWINHQLKENNYHKDGE